VPVREARAHPDQPDAQGCARTTAGTPRRLFWADSVGARSSERGSPGTKPRSCGTRPAKESVLNRRLRSVSYPAHPHNAAPGPPGSGAMKQAVDRDHDSRVLKSQSDRLPAGKLFPVRGKGLPLWAGPRNAPRFPVRARRWHQDRCNPQQRQSSARPDGCDAPAGSVWALAGGFRPRRAAGASQDRNDGPGQSAWGARKIFLSSGQAANGADTFSASRQWRAWCLPVRPRPGQNLNRPPTNRADALSNSVRGSE